MSGRFATHPARAIIGSVMPAMIGALACLSARRMSGEVARRPSRMGIRPRSKSVWLKPAGQCSRPWNKAGIRRRG